MGPPLHTQLEPGVRRPAPAPLPPASTPSSPVPRRTCVPQAWPLRPLPRAGQSRASGGGQRAPARSRLWARTPLPAAEPDLDRLVEVDGHHLLHAVLDHLGREEVGLPLLVHGDLAVVLQQDGADGLGGVGHVDGPVVAHHLAEVGQRAAVVQVEVAGGAARSASHCAPLAPPTWVIPPTRLLMHPFTARPAPPWALESEGHTDPQPGGPVRQRVAGSVRGNTLCADSRSRHSSREHPVARVLRGDGAGTEAD